MSGVPEPRTVAGQAALADVIADPARAVIAIDYDGTLAPIVERPEDARPAAGAVAALAALCDRFGACAVVTGRGALEAVRLGGFDGIRRLHVLGHYGLQEWVGGELTSPPVPPEVDQARRRLTELVAAAPSGVHLEDKELSIVVHTRPAADPAGALAALTPDVEAVATALGLEAVPGRFVVEVRPPGVDKGVAVRRLVEQRDARTVVYIGDDLADLPAFGAVESLRRDGRAGLTIASVSADAPGQLADRADLVLDGPEGVVAWLDALVAAVGAP